MSLHGLFHRRNIAVAVFYAATFVIILVIRLVRAYASPGAGEMSDSIVLADMASLPWMDAGLWGGLKPPLVALCYKMLRMHPPAIAIFQGMFSLLCWGLLAWALSRVMRARWLKPLAYTLVMLFGLSADIILWDFAIMSESLSISLFALLAALAFWLLDQWHPAKLAALIIAGGLWASARETNAWLLLGLAGAVGVFGLFHGKRRIACIVLAACWCAVFAANTMSSRMSAQKWTIQHDPAYAAFDLPPGMGQRWILPFLNVLANRILPDPEKVQWFAEHGMPVTPELMRLAGHLGGDDYFAVYRLDSMQPFRAWLINRGQVCYMKYLIHDFPATLLAPWRNIKLLLSSDTGEPRPPGFIPVLPAWLNAGIYPPLVFPFWPWIAGLIALAGLIFACLDRRRAWWIAMGLLLLAYPHALLVWHGDAMAFARHALLFQIQLRLAVWIGLLFVIDSLSGVFLSQHVRNLEGQGVL